MEGYQNANGGERVWWVMEVDVGHVGMMERYEDVLRSGWR